MPGTEEKIKDFARKAGVNLVGVAGPGRFDGPPSLNPAYTLPGAKSIVSIALPLDVPSINEFLGKVSPIPHNIDHIRVYQQINRISKEIADYITSLGYRAKYVPGNSTYRRALDPFSTRPSFSHRFGAVVSGIGAFGLSGNLVTKEYGAAVVIGTIVTDAKLNSDPVLPARFIMDNRCRTCKLCDKACSLGTFCDNEEEYLLINGELHARGKRNSMDFCNAACFGLHAISRDKKWTTWGQHWIKEWVDSQPDPDDPQKIRSTYMKWGARTGDGFARFDSIRNFCRTLHPRELVEDFLPEYDKLPKDEVERARLLLKAHENMGSYGLDRDVNVLTCGQCMLVCGKDFEETRRRFDLLTNSGYVVAGPDWKMIHVKTFEEAAALKSKYRRKVSPGELFKDNQANARAWITDYFGFPMIEEAKGWMYQRKARQACARVGLKGKDARGLFLLNPLYIFGMAMFAQRKDKASVAETKS